MLRTRCILAPKELFDGLRISVMSRHTLNDGVTPDVRITRELYDLHLTAIAPSLVLLGDYYKRDLPWKDFERRYLDYLRNPVPSQTIDNIANLMLERDVTLLCIEESPEYCHRRLLAEEIARRYLGISLDIR